MARRKTRQVNIGGVSIGGDNPVAIQSMCNKDGHDAAAVIEQIKMLEASGCHIIRIAVPDEETADNIPVIKRETCIPLVADIHFDHRLAIKAIEKGADKIRINPGNIGGYEKVRDVAKAASERHIPIRVGVNSGSLEKDLLERYGGVTAESLTESALRNTGILEDMGFEDIVISIKSSDVRICIDAYKLLSQKTDHPLHLGVTEAGTDLTGSIKSAVALGTLLSCGIGDTIRVSLSSDPINEIRACRIILKSLGLYTGGVDVISCPTCARTGIDVIGIASRVEELTKDIDKDLKVAVMGCAVNGPGEARDADIGIAGGKGEGIIFAHGEMLRKVKEEELLDALLEEIRRVT